jgi:hypothetical protein
MDVLIFVSGICLGSLGGFLLSLLVMQGRAASLAEEALDSQNRMHALHRAPSLQTERERFPATAPRRPYAPSSTPVPASAQTSARTPLRTPVAEISAAGWVK